MATTSTTANKCIVLSGGGLPVGSNPLLLDVTPFDLDYPFLAPHGAPADEYFKPKIFTPGQHGLTACAAANDGVLNTGLALERMHPIFPTQDDRDSESAG
jgi:hypothetical protein